MKHDRHLELNTTFDELLGKHVTDSKCLLEDHQAGPRFFRGVVTALPISLLFWALVSYFVF